MKAIILAAGRGSRMKSLTQETPKCLVAVAGKSLLQWQLEALKQAGISEIYVVRGYQKEQLSSSAYFAIDNPLWEQTNMVYSLYCARNILQNSDVIISYADGIYSSAIFQQLREETGDLVLPYDERWLELWQDRFSNPLSDAETFQSKEGCLLEIGKRASSLGEIQGQYMGLLKTTSQGWSWIEKVILEKLDHLKSLDMTSLLSLLLERGHPIRTVAFSGKWAEVDREEDVTLYAKKLQTNVWSHDWRK